ncbi:MAG TPA: hypothetical protein VN770_10480 [Gaiellaceae bacterium]|nr:hypothetical protein [Gaiellaceae bacterium]
MKKFAVLVGVVAVAVLATAALSGNAGVKKSAGEQARVATLQHQVNELRNELICLTTVSGNDAAASIYATSGTSAENPVNDHGICHTLGVTVPGTKPAAGSMTRPFVQLVKRAFSG